MNITRKNWHQIRFNFPCRRLSRSHLTHKRNNCRLQHGGLRHHPKVVRITIETKATATTHSEQRANNVTLQSYTTIHHCVYVYMCLFYILFTFQQLRWDCRIFFQQSTSYHLVNYISFFLPILLALAFWRRQNFCSYSLYSFMLRLSVAMTLCVCVSMFQKRF